MPDKLDTFAKRVMSGELAGIAGDALRGLLGAAEPLYAGAMRRRNRAFDTGRRASIKLARPTISVGNLTTGGTGKTPTVRWLCEKLLRDDLRPAVLLRGYKSKQTAGSDEQLMLEQFLGHRGVIVQANPDRVAGASAALAQSAQINAFILDDGFQHRRVKRDVDLVLISAVEPFGFGHVLPRGLLREPLEGLSRAHAVIVTHAQQVNDAARAAIEAQVRLYNPTAPIYLADHEPIGFRGPSRAPGDRVDHDDASLRGVPTIAFCGLGNPHVFERQLQQLGANLVGTRWFNDHHGYTPADIEGLYKLADEHGAQVIVTTEKDWVKVSKLPRRLGNPEIRRLDVALRFWFDHEKQLMDQMRVSIK